jgi:flagellar basal-body rod protein FlgB
MMIAMFDKTVSFLSKALDVMSLRHQIIASNIANQDTPNYKAADIKFHEELESALKANGTIEIQKTDPKHMAPGDPYAPVASGNIFMRPDGAGYDGNNVNAELEMAIMAKNTIMYDTAAQIVSGKLKALSSAIRDSR